MESTDMKQCPYCAEFIQKDAIKCRYCGNTLDGPNRPAAHREHWSRVDYGKRIAGVCTGITAELNAPQLVLPLRLFFLISILFGGFGILLYIILWVLMPRPPRDTSSSGISGPTGDIPDDISPPGRKDSLLAVVAFVIFALLLTFAVVYFIVPFIHTIGIPGIPLPHITWHQISSGNGFFYHFKLMPWSLPVLLILIIGLTVLLLLSFRMFRPALGCLGVVLATIVVLLLLTILIPVAIVPAALLLPLLIIVGGIVLLIAILKALLD